MNRKNINRESMNRKNINRENMNRKNISMKNMNRENMNRGAVILYDMWYTIILDTTIPYGISLYYMV